MTFRALGTELASLRPVKWRVGGTDDFAWNMYRRDALRLALSLSAAAGLCLAPPRAHAAGTINFADIGVGDPGGDWSKFKAASGYDVNLVSIGNAPSAVLNVLIASGGQGTYDIINIVGGMQKPLVDNDLSSRSTPRQLPNWAKDSYVEEFLGKGKPGFQFIGLQDKIYGVPTVLQGDFFAYLPEKTGKLDSYAALFDPKWKGLWRSRTTTPRPARRPRSISRRPASPRSPIPTT